VNVVTQGGGNQLHGSAWEFLRNNALDARDPFLDEFDSSPSPFRQNQFGALISGPVFIPKAYNGRNRTFFLFDYEGWRYRQAAQTRYRVPTAQELSGDFSSSIVGRLIYDPATTRPDPSAPSGYIRDQFANNVIPASRIDPTTLNFLKTYFGTPNLTGDPVYNAIVTRSNSDDSNHYDARLDQQVGNSDNLFFRYSRLNVTDTSPLTVSETSVASVPADNIAGGWTHIFGPSLILETRAGATSRPFSRSQTDTAGIAAMKGLGFTSSGGTTLDLAAPWGSAGIQNPNSIESPALSVSQSLVWIYKGHNFKTGYQYIRQGNSTYSPPYGDFSFTDATTGDPSQVGTTGISLASALLGLPEQTNNSNTLTRRSRNQTAEVMMPEWASIY
jgi:hypothetical protein